MKRWWAQIREEYYETRYNSGEDWLEWFIKRKMTWGWRWILALTIYVFYRLFFIDPRNIPRFFYFLWILGFVYATYELISYLVRRKRK